MEKGDIIVITLAHEPYFKIGDKAILLGKDPSGDWWGDFTINEIFQEPGMWCLIPENCEYKQFNNR